MAIEFHPIGSCETVWLTKGRYKLEVWGAEGGNCSQTHNGLGGYSVGIYHLHTSKQLTVCVGKQGESSFSEAPKGGFNGGGNGSLSQSSTLESCAGGGGGATDIRTSPSLDNRILVAGGGGGIIYYYQTVYHGGHGGGTNGGTGRTGGSEEILNRYGSGATQKEPGVGGYYFNTQNNKYCYGSNGTFGDGGTSCSIAQTKSSGGGGGYFGGGGGADTGTGGGGSGYGSPNLVRSQLYSGNVPFLSPSGQLETGHHGNGFAKITLMSHHTKDCFPHFHVFSPFFFLFLFK